MMIILINLMINGVVLLRFIVLFIQNSAYDSLSYLFKIQRNGSCSQVAGDGGHDQSMLIDTDATFGSKVT